MKCEECSAEKGTDVYYCNGKKGKELVMCHLRYHMKHTGYTKNNSLLFFDITCSFELILLQVSGKSQALALLCNGSARSIVYK